MGGKGRVTEILGKVRESLYSINEGSAKIPIAGMRSGLGWVEVLSSVYTKRRAWPLKKESRGCAF